MKKQILILWMLWCLTVLLGAEKLAVLPEILKPDSLVADTGRIFVIEGATVFVYSRSDFSLLKKFGRQGEGPGEFIPSATVIPRKNDLFVTSVNRISTFSRTGEFIRSERPANFYQIFPLGDGYAARGTAIDGNLHFITINILDEKLNIIKELARMQSLGQRGDRISPIQENSFI